MQGNDAGGSHRPLQHPPLPSTNRVDRNHNINSNSNNNNTQPSKIQTSNNTVYNTAYQQYTTQPPHEGEYYSHQHNQHYHHHQQQNMQRVNSQQTIHHDNINNVVNFENHIQQGTVYVIQNDSSQNTHHVPYYAQHTDYNGIMINNNNTNVMHHTSQQPIHPQPQPVHKSHDNQTHNVQHNNNNQTLIVGNQSGSSHHPKKPFFSPNLQTQSVIKSPNQGVMSNPMQTQYNVNNSNPNHVVNNPTKQTVTPIGQTKILENNSSFHNEKQNLAHYHQQKNLHDAKFNSNNQYLSNVDKTPHDPTLISTNYSKLHNHNMSAITLEQQNNDFQNGNISHNNNNNMNNFHHNNTTNNFQQSLNHASIPQNNNTFTTSQQSEHIAQQPCGDGNNIFAPNQQDISTMQTTTTTNAHASYPIVPAQFNHPNNTGQQTLLPSFKTPVASHHTPQQIPPPPPPLPVVQNHQISSNTQNNIQASGDQICINSHTQYIPHDYVQQQNMNHTIDKKFVNENNTNDNNNMQKINNNQNIKYAAGSTAPITTSLVVTSPTPMNNNDTNNNNTNNPVVVSDAPVILLPTVCFIYDDGRTSDTPHPSYCTKPPEESKVNLLLTIPGHPSTIMAHNIYRYLLSIKFLPRDTSSKDLFDLFSPFGELLYVEAKHPHRNNVKFTIGLVSFRGLHDALHAIKQMHHHSFRDRVLKVEFFESSMEITGEALQTRVNNQVIQHQHGMRYLQQQQSGQPQQQQNEGQGEVANTQNNTGFVNDVNQQQQQQLQEQYQHVQQPQQQTIVSNPPTALFTALPTTHTNPHYIPKNKLYIVNLPPHWNDYYLSHFFRGTYDVPPPPALRIIKYAKVLTDKYGASRRIGFVEFDTIESATEAKQVNDNRSVPVLNDNTLGPTATLIVRYAKDDVLPGQAIRLERRAKQLQTRQKELSNYLAQQQGNNNNAATPQQEEGNDGGTGKPTTNAEGSGEQHADGDDDDDDDDDEEQEEGEDNLLPRIKRKKKKGIQNPFGNLFAVNALRKLVEDYYQSRGEPVPSVFNKKPRAQRPRRRHHNGDGNTDDVGDGFERNDGITHDGGSTNRRNNKQRINQGEGILVFNNPHFFYPEEQHKHSQKPAEQDQHLVQQPQEHQHLVQQQEFQQQQQQTVQQIVQHSNHQQHQQPVYYNSSQSQFQPEEADMQQIEQQMQNLQLGSQQQHHQHMVHHNQHQHMVQHQYQQQQFYQQQHYQQQQYLQQQQQQYLQQQQHQMQYHQQQQQIYQRNNNHGQQHIPYQLQQVQQYQQQHPVNPPLPFDVETASNCYNISYSSYQ